MSLMDHIAVITHNSLAAATVNKLNPAKPPEFFAQIAFPPEAGAELHALCQAAAGAVPLEKYQIGITTNAAKGTKELPGVPGDWFIVRASTQYAPYVADASGAQLDQSNPQQAAVIKSGFYAGKKVRAALSAYAWNFGGKTGISFNLQGVMDAGEDSERLNIGAGSVANAFAAHARPDAKPLSNIAQMNANAPVSTPNNANPFAQGGAATGANGPAHEAQTGGNPFAQPAAVANKNPFA